MVKFKNIENKKNITYELACHEGELTSKDKKVLKLVKKIEEDEHVVKELKEFSKIHEILMVEIIRKCKGQKERLVLLQHALLYSHKATLEYVIKGAEKYKLFEKIAGKEIISERLDDHGNTISRTYSTVMYEDGVVYKKTLKSGGKTPDENSKKVLDPNKINKGNVAVGMFTETALYESREEAKNSSPETVMKESKACDMPEDVEKECKNGLEVKEHEEVTNVDKARKTDIQLSKDTNKYSQDFDTRQPIFESMEKTETEITAKEKAITKRRVIKVDQSLLDEESFRGNFNATTIEHAKEKAVSTQRLIPLDRSLLDDKYTGNFNPMTVEHAKEKAVSTQRLIPLDPVLLDNEDNENFHLTFENSKKAQNSSIKTAVQEHNTFCILPFQQSFNGDAEKRKERSLTKVKQQRRRIIAGGAGTVLLVSSIALHLMKMHIIAVVGGIIGLACMSFALYNLVKPDTKLERIEGIEQPAHSSLEPT